MKYGRLPTRNSVGGKHEQEGTGPFRLCGDVCVQQVRFVREYVDMSDENEYQSGEELGQEDDILHPNQIGVS